MVQSFPREYENDVRAVIKKLYIKSVAFNGILYSDRFIDIQLLSGENIRIPYRIYIEDIPFGKCLLTPVQKIIYSCIFTRSYSGYVREKYAKELLEKDLPEWAIPFIIGLSSDYVKEIQSAIYGILKEKNNDKYKELCSLNFDYIGRAYSVMLSYWNEYYRYGTDCIYSYKNHVGYKLFSECYGYFKTGQKFIRT